MVLNWIDLSLYFVLSGQERPLWVSGWSGKASVGKWLLSWTEAIVLISLFKQKEIKSVSWSYNFGEVPEN